MHNSTSEMFFACTTLRTTFSRAGDDADTYLGGHGTGFFIRSPTKGLILVTNKHNLVPSMNGKEYEGDKLVGLTVIARKQVGGPTGYYLPKTKEFDVNLQVAKVVFGTGADVALVCLEDSKAINYKDHDNSFRVSSVPVDKVVADRKFIENNLRPTDAVAFFGFPKNEKGPVYDTQWNTPIVRTAFIASLPGTSFTNPSVTSDNVILVDGFSFAGSSGSPVILPERGLSTAEALSGTGDVALRVIGIMSGHWKQSGSAIEHFGLSYFTRSDSILDLIVGL